MDIKRGYLLICFSVFTAFAGQAQSQKTEIKLLGYAIEQFVLGKEIYHDKLENKTKFSENWVVQMNKADSSLKRYARIEGGKLEVQDPRGCTIWFKSKMKGPLMITYRVTASSKYNQGNDIVPRDINQFWMAQNPDNIPAVAKGGLFDAEKYEGDFKSYDPILCYYASTGGGNTTNYNRTTRIRRYPRKIDGKQADHLGLNFRDDDKDFLIVPDKEHLVQLVAADDIVQYIVDGKIVYQIKKGDSVGVFNDANTTISKGVWGEAPFTYYSEGYFGFRMTRTHHTYSDFQVFRLNKIK
jgi:hypothetical protein